MYKVDATDCRRLVAFLGRLCPLNFSNSCFPIETFAFRTFTISILTVLLDMRTQLLHRLLLVQRRRSECCRRLYCTHTLSSLLYIFRYFPHTHTPTLYSGRFSAHLHHLFINSILFSNVRSLAAVRHQCQYVYVQYCSAETCLRFRTTEI